MRKSFTWLGSFLVIMLLSFQMALAAPTLKDVGGLKPKDNGAVDPGFSVFTMTFNGAVAPGEGQIIGLFNNVNNAESKAIQLRAVDKTVDGSTITYNHEDGIVVFNGSVVTIQFKDLTLIEGANYWITFGASAIKDAGNGSSFDLSSYSKEGADSDSKWEFKVNDKTAPIISRLTPKDGAINVSTTQVFTIKFKETVKFAAGTSYSQKLEDFAIYTSTSAGNVNPQEGGDLVSVNKPTLTLYLGTVAGSMTAFDSIAITWTALPAATDLYVRVKPGIIADVSGNSFAGINNETIWNITTKDDAFAKPDIASTNTPLWSTDNFTIDFDNAEELYLGSTGTLIANGQDLKSIVSLTDKNGAAVEINTATFNKTTNTITIDPKNDLVSSLAPYTVSIAAGAVKDKSGNSSQANSKAFNAGNWDAPTLVSAKVVNNGGTTMDFLVTTNEKATVHYIVVRADKANTPTLDNVFGYAADATASGTVIVKEGTADNDTYYRLTPANVAAATDPDATLPTGQSTLATKQFYGKQTGASKFSIDEIFAEGDISVPTGNFEVLKRITGLPASHGQAYEIYYVLIDGSATQGKYGTTFYNSTTEHISDMKVLTANVNVVDILMPEVWFDADSSTVNPASKTDGLVNDTKAKANTLTTLGRIARDGKIYLNFNEAVRKSNGAALTAADLKASLFVYEGTAALPGGDRNADTGWSTNYGFSASLANSDKTIVITPDSSWASSSHIWVKLRNSKIEDLTGNEVVPYGNYYTQEFLVEDYVAPIVRYSYNGLYNSAGAFAPANMDSMLSVPYQKYVDGAFQTAEITVTVSEHIYVFPGALINGSTVTNSSGLLEFTSNPADDQYIGNFFKIRKGTGSAVNESMGNAIEDEFEFTIDYNYGDSTLIHIKPKAQYASEVWYFVEMDERIQDVNLQTIGQGATVPFASRPKFFTAPYSNSGNATVTGWVRNTLNSFQDNGTLVFKSEDSVNPTLTFFSKKQSTLLTSLKNINGLTNVDLKDTIGVFINEYVGLGFDHYVKLDAVTGRYTLDANAMRRYFKVFDTDGNLMQFDVVDIYTAGLAPAKDTMIFYIDPYYVDANGQPLPKTETDNFKSAKSYRVYFNSQDADDQGIEDASGKTKGIYWDDNKNLVLETAADFTTVSTATQCLASVITPATGSTVAPSLSAITVAFDYAIVTVPTLTINNGATIGAGSLVPGNSFKATYPVSGLVDNTTYSVTAGNADGVTNQFVLNTGIAGTTLWPVKACYSPMPAVPGDSTWTFKTADGTKPVLTTATAFYGGSEVDTHPSDDSQNFAKTDDIRMYFNEEVTLVTGKKLTIYDSSNKTVAVVYAQNCTYGKKTVSGKDVEDKHVVIVPSAYWASGLKYTTDYHIIIDDGFVTDATGNKWVGVTVEDLDTGLPTDNGTNDTAAAQSDWAFQTGSDPAPAISKYLTKDGLSGVVNLQVQFSEPVYTTNSATELVAIYEVTAGPTFTLVDAFRSSETTKITPNSTGNIWTINSTNSQIDLKYGKQYAVVLPTGAFKDSNGSALTAGTSTTGVVYASDPVLESTQSTVPGIWYVNFTDAVAPYVLNTWPRPTAKHVPYNAYIYLEFNEPVSISDGSAIIPDPNANLIDGFISVENAGNPLSSAEYNVEFVGNDKKLLRITVMDPAGYNYSGSTNPTMETEKLYTVTLGVSNGTYRIVDGNNNQLTVAKMFQFTTEDITAPVITAITNGGINCSNELVVSVNVTEVSDTALVYYAIVPGGANAPSASDLFAGTVSGAIKTGTLGADGGANNYTIKLGSDFIENPQFNLFAVTRDLEVDIWTPVSSAWDSLFFFGTYGEGYDRIKDIMPSPNKNNTVVAIDSKFRVWDNDAPVLHASNYNKHPESYPASGAVQVPIADSVAFWFSEKVTKGLAGFADMVTLRRYDNNIKVDATVTYKDADSSIVLKPVLPLEQETKYYVEIDRYAVKDKEDVCAGDSVFFPQMVGRGYYFTTQDNIGPRLAKTSPANADDCVFCPDLNAAGDQVITLTFYDANALKATANAADPYVYLYRGLTATVAWDVIPASSITFAQGKNDTTWVATIPLSHEFYANDVIEVRIPTGLISDIYGNKHTEFTATNTFHFTTCNSAAPVASVIISSLEGYFNYSEATAADNGIYGKWTTYSKTNDVPTHVSLKVDFGEAVQFNTSGTTWKNLSDLTDKELMAILNISGLSWVAKSDGSMDPDKSNVQVLDKDVANNRVVTLGLRYAKNAVLPTYQLLVDAAAQTHIPANGLVPANYYTVSLNSNQTYAVTVSAGKVRASSNCASDKGPRYVGASIASFTTRDDSAPMISFANAAGAPLCETTTCISATEVININFTTPVVKSSYDVSWLGEESYSFDNLPLNSGDLSDTDGSNYIAFYQIIPTYDSGSKTWSYPRTGSAIAVNVVKTDDAGKVNYQIQPKNALVSEGWYTIVFNKHTIKKFEAGGPNGTVFEGDSCHFFVGDYVAPKVATVDGFTPSNGKNSVGSDTKELKIIFDEGIALGTGITKIRRLDGSVFAQFSATDPNVVLYSKTNVIGADTDTLVFKLSGGLEEFTKYYVEMPAGFVVDDNTVCSGNAFKGLAAKLGSDGKLISADWSFMTSDATPPQLISVNKNGVDLDPLALFPQVGTTVAKNSDLSLIFDENITVGNDANHGIVIYHSNGAADAAFGNAVEFIPWSEFGTAGSRIVSAGTDIYNGYTANKLVVNPNTTFETKGTYYVRVNGDSIKDGSNNSWSQSTKVQIDPVKDTEWYFSIVNDVQPVLVMTDPTYDGVNAPQAYVTLKSDSTIYGYVKADLTLTFYDNTIANGGKALDVSRGDNLRMVRIFEYTYDAASAQFKSKPWISMPITDPSIDFVGNQVILRDVMLKDGINGVGSSVINDSVYYVTVDPGAVLNGYSASQTFWPGIDNGFRWRFQTEADTMFVPGYEIVSPNAVEDGEAALNLTIDAVDSLVISFNEAVKALDSPAGVVRVWNTDAEPDVLVEAITVTQAMCNGNTLKIPVTKLVDETSYAVTIDAAAFGDGATVQNLSPAIGGGEYIWTFSTGDNTAPVPAVSPAIDGTCVVANPTITLTFDESKGVSIIDASAVTVADANGPIDGVVVGTPVLDSTKTVITVDVTGLPDITQIFVTLAAGFVLDGDTISPLANPEVKWSFTTGDNTAPTATVIAPTAAVTVDSTVLTLEFSEPVNVGTLSGVVMINGVEVTLTSTDSITYSGVVKKLASEKANDVIIEAGAFVDAGCQAMGNESATLTFNVADISVPVAMYYPSTADDYIGLELVMDFDDAVAATTGNVVIYDAKTDVAVDTISVKDFVSTNDSTFTYTTNSLYYGSFYVMVDANSFVDATATVLGKDYAGVADKTTWTIDITDDKFVDYLGDGCSKIISPIDGSTGVSTTIDLVFEFCSERIIPGSANKYITVAKQSNVSQDAAVQTAVVDSMISVVDGKYRLTIHAEGLEEMTTYSVIIAPGAITDEAGNAFEGIIDANAWNFTTVDATTPVVTLVPGTVSNLNGSAAMTRDEVGAIYFVHESVPSELAAITAAIANMKAVASLVATAGVNVTVSTTGLVAGTYRAVAIDAAGNVGESTDVVVVEEAPEYPVKTIAEIQGTGDASPLVGQTIKTTGVVTAVDANGYFIQDANAAYSGVYVYDKPSAAVVGIGSGVTVIGTVSEYNGLTEIGSLISVEYVAPVVKVAALVISSADANTEKYEGVLATVKMLKTTDAPDSFGEWLTKTDDGTVVKIDNQFLEYTPAVGQRYNITGVVNYTYSEYKLAPRMNSDIEVVTDIADLGLAIDVYPNPFNDHISIRVSSDVVLTKAVITNVAGQLVKEVINPESTIATSDLRKGVYFISLHTESGIAKTERIIKR